MIFDDFNRSQHYSSNQEEAKKQQRDLRGITDKILSHRHRNTLTAFLVLDFKADPDYGEYHNPYPLTPDNLAHFFKEYPNPNSFHQKALEIAYFIGSHPKMGLQARLVFRKVLEDLGQILYGTEWDKEVVKSRHQRKRDAFKTSKTYKETHRIRGKIPDGFVDVGRGGELSLFDKHVKTIQGVRETLIVDKTEDIGLQDIITKAKKIKEEYKDEAEALFFVVKLIHSRHKTDLDMTAWRQKMDPLKGEEIFIGDYEGKTGYPGICRHESLMLQTVLAELGYNITLVRGIVKNYQNDAEGHSWCEVRLKGKIVVIDISMQSNKYKYQSYETFKAIEDFPVIQGDSSQIDPQRKIDYYDVTGQWLYCIS